jgi:hypothetical protein
MKFLGRGALDISPKYVWTFSIVLIFIHMYNVSVTVLLRHTVPEEEE